MGITTVFPLSIGGARAWSHQFSGGYFCWELPGRPELPDNRNQSSIPVCCFRRRRKTGHGPRRWM